MKMVDLLQKNSNILVMLFEFIIREFPLVSTVNVRYRGPTFTTPLHSNPKYTPQISYCPTVIGQGSWLHIYWLNPKSGPLYRTFNAL